MINIEEKYLEKNLDTRWDNQKVSYDTNKYNWHELFFNFIKTLYPKVDDLTKIHDQLETTKLVELRKHLEKFTCSEEFSKKVDLFVEDILKDRFDHNEYLVQVTPGLRIVVPNQLEKNRLLNFHTGYWTGYDNGTNTIWTPITPAFGSNTMQVTDWNTSRTLMKQIHQESWKLDKIQQECEAVSWPVDVKVGESWLFNQGHLHGNINNDTGQSRMSFDVRIAHKGINFGRRRPGSFYRFPQKYIQLKKENIKKDKSWIVFVSPNDEYIDMAPYFMIREYLLQWCKQLDIRPNEWSNEYHECDWMPKFKDFISKKNIGIVFPSIYNFSISVEERLECFKEAITNNIQLLFCDENLIVDNMEDLKIIKKYYEYYYKQ
jgi:hypothetical protein